MKQRRSQGVGRYLARARQAAALSMRRYLTTTALRFETLLAGLRRDAPQYEVRYEILYEVLWVALLFQPGSPNLTNRWLAGVRLADGAVQHRLKHREIFALAQRGMDYLMLPPGERTGFIEGNTTYFRQGFKSGRVAKRNALL